MDYSRLFANIQKHVSLTTGEADQIKSVITVKELQRKELLLEEGKACSHIYFVHEGMLRAFYRDRDLTESIIMFAIADWWITDMASFASRQPAQLYIDALEESIVFGIHKDDMDKLFIDVPPFERFFRVLMQNAYIREQQRAIQNLSMTAAERYEAFQKKYPHFSQRVPLKQIASYLGMTPEFLSVVRKKSK